ncbi:MAG: sporulation protein YabP [Oscillospiraceae bacterium]|jgi:sporulation protein YabP|nr:sporulation protein YabP [Oscillospiraceae bacterium]
MATTNLPESRNTAPQKRPHNFLMEGRKKLSITAVRDVALFEETSIVLNTDMGELTLGGKNLHINRLSVETGEIDIEGYIENVSYDDNPSPKGGGILSKLFR